MLGATLVVLVTMAGFRSTVGILVDPLRDEFGWTTASISLAAGLNLLLYGFGGPFAAALYDRFGLRRNGIATGAVSVTLAAVVANRWFVARRGLATGILTAANATGQLVFLPGLAWAADAHGWRWSVGAVAAVAAVIVLPTALLPLRDWPFGRRVARLRRGRGRSRARRDGQPVPDGDRRRSRPRLLVTHVLAPQRQLLHLRRDDERPRRHAPDPGGDGSRHRSGRRCGPPRDDRRLRPRRDTLLGLAHRPLRPACPPRLVLRPARALAARAADRDRVAGCGARRVRGLLRPRLGRDGAAHRRAHRRHLRPRARRGRLRLDLRRTPARRGYRALAAGATETVFGTYAPAFVGAALLSLVAAFLSTRIEWPETAALAPA